MSFPVRGWPLAAMIALALAVFPVSRAVGQDGWQTLSPKQLPATVQLFNSLSGPIASLSQSPASLQLVPPSPAYNDPAPLSGIPVDEYGRLSWHSLEPAEGQYDSPSSHRPFVRVR